MGADHAGNAGDSKPQRQRYAQLVVNLSMSTEKADLGFEQMMIEVIIIRLEKTF